MKLLSKVMIALFLTCSILSCSPENEIIETDQASENIILKSAILEPEVEYLDVLNSFYTEYEVSKWIDLKDEEGYTARVKEITNPTGSMAYLIEDPEDGHFSFVDRNDDTEVLNFIDLTAKTNLNFCFAGQLPIKVEPGDGDAGVVTNGWFRRFTKKFFGPGESTGPWTSRIGGQQQRWVAQTFTVLFMEFDNGGEWEYQGC
jgi:hypothetical protein